jgi:hypothetical protein
MSAATVIALLMSVRTAAQEARAAQVRASRERAANTTRPRRKDEDTPAVPVAIPSAVSACVRRLNELCESLERAREDTGVALNRQALRRIARRYALRWQALRAFVGVFAGLDASEGFDPSALRAREVRVRKGHLRALWELFRPCSHLALVPFSKAPTAPSGPPDASSSPASSRAASASG